MKVSVYVALTSIASLTLSKKANIISLGAGAAGIITSPDHVIRHLNYVIKRNKFYKKHNIKLNKKSNNKIENATKVN